ncbi:MAG: LysM peptidoglycan-binding domain-containing protein [Psychromonas sp.]|nr:LysM peptidoglycan-binding domain-containing protein [Psychromonas sp.]
MKYFIPLLLIFFLFGCQTTSLHRGVVPASLHKRVVSAEKSTNQTNIVKVDVLDNKAGLYDLNDQITQQNNKDGKPISYDSLWKKLADGFTINVPSNSRITKEREKLLKEPKHLQQILKRAEPFLYLIVSKLEKQHLPLEIALLPIVESSFNPHAYSSSGAVGLWQIMPQTSLRFGLQQNRWYDGRKDVYLSTDAALAYLKLTHKYLGKDWLCTFAAYNSGEGRVQRAIQENEKKHQRIDYWSLPLPEETKEYVPKLLALIDILRHHEKYGFKLPPLKNKQVLTYVKTDTRLALSYAGKLCNLSVAEIQLLNPALNSWATPPNGPYSLLLPTKTASSFLKQLHKDTQPGFAHYVVRSGDSLSVIAHKNNLTTNALKKENNLKGTILKSGEILKIPRINKARLAFIEAQEQHNVRHYSKANTSSKSKVRLIKVVYTVAEGDTLWDISRLYNVTVSNITKWNHLSIKKPLRLGTKLRILQPSKIIFVALGSGNNSHFKHRVVSGDSLWTISQNYQVSTNNLLKWNHLRKNEVLRLGQIILIKGPLTATITRENVLKHTVVEGDNLSKLSHLYGISVDEMAKWNKLNKKSPLKLGNVLIIKSQKLHNKIKLIYKVKNGDTVGGIAYKFNVQRSDVVLWNNLKNPKKLKIGKSLTLYVVKVL